MKRYTFKIELCGYGEDAEEAEQDIAEIYNITFDQTGFGDLGDPIEIVEVDPDTFIPIKE